MNGTKQQDGDAIVTGDARIITSGAERMRRSRERRRRGKAIVTLEVMQGVIADLIALGWLPETDHGDKSAVACAVIDLVERAIWAHITPYTGSQSQICFTCGLQGTTVDALISLGWLQADCAGDIDAIAKAFRRFAGRALDVARRGAFDLWNIRRR
jgi:hypothetical protein